MGYENCWVLMKYLWVTGKKPLVKVNLAKKIQKEIFENIAQKTAEFKHDWGEPWVWKKGLVRALGPFET